MRFQSITSAVAREVEKAKQSAMDESARAERRGAAEAYRRAGLKPAQIAAAMAGHFPGERFNAKVVRIQIARARVR